MLCAYIADLASTDLSSAHLISSELKGFETTQLTMAATNNSALCSYGMMSVEVR